MSVQGSSEWLSERAGKFSGSRFAKLMAKGRGGEPSATRRELIAILAVERMTGTCVETYSNGAMERGKELEEEARQAYEARAGVLTVEEGFIAHPDLPFVGVSPDGLVGDDGLVEIKCPNNMAKHADALREGSHAKEYHWQIQGQMWVTGRAWCDVVSYDPRFPEGLQIAVVRIPADPSAAKALREACEAAELEVLEQLHELTKLKETQ